MTPLQLTAPLRDDFSVYVKPLARIELGLYAVGGAAVIAAGAGGAAAITRHSVAHDLSHTPPPGLVIPQAAALAGTATVSAPLYGMLHETKVDLPRTIASSS